MGLPQWLSGKEPTCNAGDTGLISASRRSSGEGNGNTLQYACLGNLMDRGAGGLQSAFATLSGCKESDTTEHEPLNLLFLLLFFFCFQPRHCPLFLLDLVQVSKPPEAFTRHLGSGSFLDPYNVCVEFNDNSSMCCIALRSWLGSCLPMRLCTNLCFQPHLQDSKAGLLLLFNR